MGDREPEIEVSPIWISADEDARERVLRALERDEWRPEIERMREDQSVSDEHLWCDRTQLQDIFRMKEVLNSYDQSEFDEVKRRSNPHEPLLENKVMQGQYSLLLSSIDRVTDFMLTGVNIDDVTRIRPLDTRPRGENVNREEEMFYFAESQTLPAPFASQYIWLRKGFYNSKCFIPLLAPTYPVCPLTSNALLDCNRRMKMDKNIPLHDQSFSPYATGMRDDFKNLVLQGTRGKGADLYQGFTFSTTSAHGRFKEAQSNSSHKECNQELHFRYSYVGQLFYASSIVKKGGRAVLHFLDTNTSLCVSVIYLCYIMFDRISIYKPNMSRPANAERFLICDGLRLKEAKEIHKYLETVLEKMRTDETLIRLLPDSVLHDNTAFREYIVDVNDHFLSRQYRFLQSYQRMFEERSRESTHQDECLQTCLPYYLIPYATLDEMKNIGKELRERTGGEIVRSWMEEGIEDRMIEGLSRPAKTMNQKEMREKLNSSMRLMATPVSDKLPTLIVATNHGLEFWSVQRREWITMSRMSTILPADTVFIGDVMEVPSPQYLLIVRILDVGVIFGDDVSSLPLTKRLKAAEKLVEATRKDGAKQDVFMCVAKYEEIDAGFNPNSYPERVVEDEIFIMKKKIRITRDSRDVSFYAACCGEDVWEV